jgi:hypothetical protein
MENLKSMFEYLKSLMCDETLVMLVPLNNLSTFQESKIGAENTINGNDNSILEEASLENENVDDDISTSEMFYQGRIYSVVAIRGTQVADLALIHNPWGNKKVWKGPWGNGSNEWQMHQDILELIEADRTLPWTLNQPNGYFWMPIYLLSNYFDVGYLCKLFPNEKYHSFIAKDEWKEKSAGGCIMNIRNKSAVQKDYTISRNLALQKVRPLSIYINNILISIYINEIGCTGCSHRW